MLTYAGYTRVYLAASYLYMSIYRWVFYRLQLREPVLLQISLPGTRVTPQFTTQFTTQFANQCTARFTTQFFFRWLRPCLPRRQVLSLLLSVLGLLSLVLSLFAFLWSNVRIQRETSSGSRTTGNSASNCLLALLVQTYKF